ncbi:MAG: FUSC family membrane protein [Ginsengibacter sp.]
MLKEQTKELRYFLFSQYLADGIRIALEIVLPAVVFALIGRLEIGITISLGALAVGISDGPGPVEHKKNGMLYCNIFAFLMALVTGFLNHSIFLTGLLVLFSSFFFTMFTVFGNRATTIGTAALLIMVLRISNVLPASEVVFSSLLILAGGTWYMLVALLFYRITPYRPAQRSLGDCIRETATFLKIKANLFLPTTNLEEAYDKLVHQQVAVSQKQDETRELLFKNRALLKESTHSGRKLVVTFVEVVDLYEQITANWYDYKLLRSKFLATGILEQIALVATGISNELDNIGHAIQSNFDYTQERNLVADLQKLREEIDAVGDAGINNFLLKRVLINLRKLVRQTDELFIYFNTERASKKKLRSVGEYSRFVSHQTVSFRVFRNNLTMESSVFRHALRMTIACMLGFTVSKLISYGHHSYWILMTIIIILKPGFSLTKQRNYERFTGTLAGGILGLLIIAFVQDPVVLFIIMFIFMIATYTFVRLRYLVMVICMTPYILIFFNFLGLGIFDLASERLLDTAIAAVIAFFSSYYLFPYWESKQLPAYMSSTLRANLDYLQKLGDTICGKVGSSLDYKLVRKEVIVSTANLAAAFHRMLSEPKNKQLHSSKIYEFVVLNHVLSSNIAAVTDTLSAKEKINSEELYQPVRRSINILKKSLDELDNSGESLPVKQLSNTTNDSKLTDRSLTEQVNFINKVAVDIGKITSQIAK